MRIDELYDKISGIDFDTIAANSIDTTKDALLDLNRQQLLEGKRRDGNDITPSYFDDPYFKSREAAKRYSDFKDRITPSPKRKSGTPNLFINGFFHRSIKIEVAGTQTIKFFGAFKQQDIEQKFSEFIFGLDTDFRVIYVKVNLRPEFIKRVELATNLKFS